jgi:hypothetical protein
LSKKRIGLLLTAILTVVLTTSAGYYISRQPNQSQNNPSPSPTPTPTRTPTPTPSPSKEPTESVYVSKPSIPEFTLKYMDNSYDVPPTYGIDEYTGKTIVTKPGEHVDNRTIEITIKNQAFTPFTDASSGRAINLYYDIRYKGSFGQDSTAQYTTVSYTLPWNVLEGQINFQVKALKGYVERTVEESRIIFVIYNYTVQGAESGWSNTQTITIP